MPNTQSQLDQQRKASKKLKRIRAIFDGKLTSQPRSPGFSFDTSKEDRDKIQQFRREWEGD